MAEHKGRVDGKLVHVSAFAKTEDVLEDGDTEELTRMGITTEKLNRARAMLDEFNGHIQKTLAG